MSERKISVRDLVISFRTVSGKVQAVRDISFDLDKGETLAIVGESGSGKSVTAKAIMGILAGNSIVEGGEIIYDGQDLLKIKEDDFHKIRGNKISMVFQDPMSSLNPIVKIGKQLTEAMILKGRSKQRECKREFNKKIKEIRYILEKNSDSEKFAEEEQILKDFEKFEHVHAQLENKYLFAKSNVKDFTLDARDILFEIKEKVFTDGKHRLKSLAQEAKSTLNEFVCDDSELVMANYTQLKKNIASSCRNKEFNVVVEAINNLLTYFAEVETKTTPDLFALAYHKCFVSEEYDASNIQKMNEQNQTEVAKFVAKLDSVFTKALKLYYEEKNNNALELKEKALLLREVFAKEELIKQELVDSYKQLATLASNSLNYLELEKDSVLYTFNSALNSQIKLYFYGISNNSKEERRFERETEKINRIIAKGKIPTWVPNPPAIVNLELTQQNMLKLIDNLVKRIDERNDALSSKDYQKLADQLTEFLKENTAGIYNRVTQNMAKNEAIKIMKEVGIPEPRKRYYQYPFEFSGGMRQRIVIAIALVANPDVLICDEPTTALDVTIQANILELIEELKRNRNLSIIFITHDLGVVANVADKVAVMYAGKIVETGTVNDIFYDPKHPYTWALLSSMPDLDTNEKLESIPGTPPNMIYPPKGDAFAARNKYAMKIDFEEQPPLFKVSDTHYAATWLLHKDAPKVEMPKIVTERIERMKARRNNDGK